MAQQGRMLAVLIVVLYKQVGRKCVVRYLSHYSMMCVWVCENIFVSTCCHS